MKQAIVTGITTTTLWY